MATRPFSEARRVQNSILAAPEKRILSFFARHMPGSVNSDHLTLLGLVAMALAGLFYILSRNNDMWLHLVNVMLVLNWFGDSLDGTLARYRRMQRPRYGFYVDHIVDAFSSVFLIGGLVLSGYLSSNIGIGILIVYLVLAIDVYLATYTIGTFTISFGPVSPTEGRIILAIWNCLLLFTPHTTVPGLPISLTDAAGIVVLAALCCILARSAWKNTRRLYRLEPLNRNND